ncbi:DUF6973 domain-containing protein [Nocardia goodfellowii]
MWIPKLSDFISVSEGGAGSLDVSALVALSKRAEIIETGLNDTADVMRRQIYDLQWSGAASRAATDRADHEYQDLRRVADAYGRLAEYSTNAYNEMSYSAAYLTSTTLQLLADGFTVDEDWKVQAAQGGDAERAANDTVSLQAQAKAIGMSMEKWGPLIKAVVQELRQFAPETSARFTVDPVEISLIKSRTAGAGPASLHEELLAKYNVTADPNGTVLYPDPDSARGKALALLGVEPKRITASEAAMLDQLDNHGLAAAALLEYGASEEGKTIFENEPRAGGVGDGHADAFRHAYWNALMAKEMGQDWAKNFATAHERIDDPNATHASSEAMDLHNNEIGRRIQAENPNASAAELKELVRKAVLDGRTVVLGPDGKLVYSDQVKMGDTGVAVDPPAKGGNNPEGGGSEPEQGTYN